MTNKKYLFSGIKPTGIPHIGNYLGALKQWVELQEKYNCVYLVVDYHAITIDILPEELKKNSLMTTRILLGIGIDPKKSILSLQSKISEHTELAWIFNCLTPVAEMERMTQYKDKAKEHSKNINMGLFDYPALMAADILLYKAEAVPVGEDQLQHVELTRLIARKFNNRYGQYFTEPKALISETKKIMSLNNPNKKMSKELGEASYISLIDTPEIIKKKIMKAVTDTSSSKEMAPGVKNLFDLLLYFDNKTAYDKFSELYKKREIKYSDLKAEVADAVITTLNPIREKILSYQDSEVEKILADGAEKAKAVATKNLQEMKEKIGLLK